MSSVFERLSRTDTYLSAARKAKVRPRTPSPRSMFAKAREVPKLERRSVTPVIIRVRRTKSATAAQKVGRRSSTHFSRRSKSVDDVRDHLHADDKLDIQTYIIREENPVSPNVPELMKHMTPSPGPMIAKACEVPTLEKRLVTIPTQKVRRTKSASGAQKVGRSSSTHFSRRSKSVTEVRDHLHVDDRLDIQTYKIREENIVPPNVSELMKHEEDPRPHQDKIKPNNQSTRNRHEKTGNVPGTFKAGKRRSIAKKKTVPFEAEKVKNSHRPHSRKIENKSVTQPITRAKSAGKASKSDIPNSVKHSISRRAGKPSKPLTSRRAGKPSKPPTSRSAGKPSKQTSKSRKVEKNSNNVPRIISTHQKIARKPDPSGTKFNSTSNGNSKIAVPKTDSQRNDNESKVTHDQNLTASRKDPSQESLSPSADESSSPLPAQDTVCIPQKLLSDSESLTPPSVGNNGTVSNEEEELQLIEDSLLQNDQETEVVNSDNSTNESKFKQQLSQEPLLPSTVNNHGSLGVSQSLQTEDSDSMHLKQVASTFESQSTADCTPSPSISSTSESQAGIDNINWVVPPTSLPISPEVEEEEYEEINLDDSDDEISARNDKRNQDKKKQDKLDQDKIDQDRMNEYLDMTGANFDAFLHYGSEQDITPEIVP